MNTKRRPIRISAFICSAIVMLSLLTGCQMMEETGLALPSQEEVDEAAKELAPEVTPPSDEQVEKAAKNFAEFLRDAYEWLRVNIKTWGPKVVLFLKTLITSLTTRTNG